MPLTARQSSIIALLVAGALFMEQLDGTVIATALPQMAGTFGVPPVDLNIGISAYLLTVAVFIPASGWVTDRFGARAVFASAIATFVIASIGCAFSTTLPVFTAARVVQGIGGAMMVPVGRLIVLRNTEKQDLIRAIAFLTWPALTAPVLGPPLGGLITTYASWPWIFLLNVPIGIIGLALALNLIPNTRADATGQFDWRGFVVTGLASFGLMYSLETIARNRIDWRITGPLLVVSICAGIYGFRHARRAAHPLLDLTSFALPTFAITVRGGLLIRTAISAAPFLLPLMFQLAFGLDPLASGLLLLAVFAGNLGMKPATSRVLQTFGFRRTLLVNGILVVATIMACGLMTPDTPKALIVAVLFLSGLSRSMQFTTINALSFSELSQERMSGANTLFSMMQQVGNALGVAIGAIALRLASLLHGDVAGSTTGDFHIAFLAVGLIGLAGVFEFRRLPAHAGEVLRERRAAGK